jgi:DNA-binding NarL/FixJ family response regulator
LENPDRRVGVGRNFDARLGPPEDQDQNQHQNPDALGGLDPGAPHPGPLIGRELQLAALMSVVGGTGPGGALVLRGEAGIGKSALLAAVARAVPDARILRSCGVESESGLPFAGLHQLLFPVRRVVAGLSPPHRELLDAVTGRADHGAVGDGQEVASAVLELVATLAERGRVLILADDVHWLDAATAEVLAAVAGRLTGVPAVLVAAVQPGFPTGLDAEGVLELGVPPLAAAAAAALLDRLVPALAADARHRVLVQAAGNPLALAELPHAADRTDPAVRSPVESWTPITARLGRALTARLAGLPAATRCVLEVAALNDAAALPETLAAAGVLRGEVLDLDAVVPAITACLVDFIDRELRFRYPLVRSAVRHGMGGTARQAVHEALAGVVGRDTARGVWHRAAAAARADETVAADLADLARRSWPAEGASALAALHRAGQLTPDPAVRADRLIAAADRALDLGHRALAAELLGRVHPDGLSSSQQARSATLRCALDQGVGHGEAGIAALTALAGRTAAGGDVPAALRLLWAAARRCRDEQVPPATRLGVAAAVGALAVAQSDPYRIAILAHTDPAGRGAEVLRGLADAAARPTALAAAPEAASALAAAALEVGAFGLVRVLTEPAVPGLRIQRRLDLLGDLLAARGAASVALADVAAADAALTEGLHLAGATGQASLRALLTALQAEVAALRGDGVPAEVLARTAERSGLSTGAGPVLARARLARGRAALGAGRYGEALGHLRRLFDPAEAWHQPGLRLTAFTDLVDAAVHCGAEPEVVAGALREMEAVAQGLPTPALHAALAYARALTADDPSAENLFAEASDLGAAAGSFAEARVRLAYGEWLRRRRRMVDSRIPLRAAVTAFDELGVSAWGRRARRELQASGRSGGGPAGSEGLTPRELHIARLAASGLTNKEIGQQLYLTPRTVASHLARIFPKLGVRSRAELRVVFSD